MTTPSAWPGGWRLGGVGGRVALLVLVAGVPLLLLAVAIVWQNSRLVADAPVQRVRTMRAASGARIEAVLDGTRQMVGGLAMDTDLAGAGSAACAAILQRTLALQARQLAGLAVVDDARRLRCAAPAGLFGTAAAAPSFRALLDGKAGGVAVLDNAGTPVLAVAAPLHPGAASAGAVIGVVATDALAAGPGAPASYAWLSDAADRTLPLGGEPADMLPAAAVLHRLLTSGRQVVVVRSASGAPAAFAVTAMAGGLHLLVGTATAQDMAVARWALLRRILGLLLLLGAGLAAIAVGANMTLVLPVKRLSTAVQAWRNGAPFDAGPQHGVPLELRQLAVSFAEATATLAEREQQLQRAVEQQELLMQEIHHRVKNNLQIIASLLNLQASRIRLPEAKREFASARDRIRALATLHRHLYVHGDLHTINMRSFLHELCDQLLTAMGEPPGGRIQLNIEAPALQMGSDQAVPMALIVTEAVSNSAKYAFPGGRSGHIRVVLAVTGEQARLVIEDDGVGLPEGRVETETGIRDGIGLQLIRGFARQLGGRFALTQELGTRYELDLNLRPDRGAEAAEASSTV